MVSCFFGAESRVYASALSLSLLVSVAAFVDIRLRGFACIPSVMRTPA